MMVAAVIFDLDGTLLDTLPSLAAAGNETLLRLGAPVHDMEAYRRMIGNGIPKLVARMLPQDRKNTGFEEAWSLFRVLYEEHLFTDVTPYPGILALLAQLEAEGVSCGVLTNKVQEYCTQLVARFFPGQMACVMGAGMEYPLKPNPAGLLAAIEAMGVQKERVLYVGDSEVDIQTAQNAGVAVCGVDWGFRSRESLCAAGAETIISRPEELLRLL